MTPAIRAVAEQKTPQCDNNATNGSGKVEENRILASSLAGSSTKTPSGPATMHLDRSSMKETDACSRPVKHAAGRGGIAAVSQTTGIARSTIGRGLADLRSGAVQCSERVRRRGGGQKPAIVAATPNP
jgi:hypothetical protein